MTIGYNGLDTANGFGAGISSNSITPTDKRLYFAFVTGLDNDNAQQSFSCSGWGLTWTRVQQIISFYGPTGQSWTSTLFYATGKPSAGAVTFVPSGGAVMESWGVTLLEVSNASGIRQQNANVCGELADTTGVSIGDFGHSTLSSLYASDSDCAIFGYYNTSGEFATPSGGYTQLVNWSAGFFGGHEVQKATNVTTGGYSHPSVGSIDQCVGIEIVHARPGKRSVTQQAIPTAARF